MPGRGRSNVPRIHLFGIAVAALLVVMGGVQVTSAIQETRTFDQAFHPAAGYGYLKTGDYTLNHEHPPLSKLLCTLPLLALNPALPVDDPAWKSGNLLQIADLFLYGNRVGAGRLLL